MLTAAANCVPVSAAADDSSIALQLRVRTIDDEGAHVHLCPRGEAMSR